MDRGERDTEKLLKEVEKRINKEYKQAIDEMEDSLQDYFRRFEKKDETWRNWVENGTRSEDEYRKWRYGQMAVGRRWQDEITLLAKKMADANEEAKGLIRKYTPEMYADNFNYSTYQIEKDASIDTSFNLVNKEAVARLMRDDPDVLPAPGKKVSQEIAEGKAVRWNRQQLQSVMTQGLLQGDSIPKLATRLANTVGDRNRKAAIRNARTMATGAQNAGRVDAYKRAQSKGVDMEQMWLATMDNRTRHSHRWLDREVRPVGEAFSNGCEYPGDPKGDPAEIYNCRCSLRGVVKGLERRSGKFRDDSALGGMSYDEWRNAKAKSNPITLPEEKAKNIKNSFINEYRYGRRGNGIIRFKEEGVSEKVGEAVEPTPKTMEMALNKQEYAMTIANKYGINLRGSGRAVTIEIDETIPSYGKVRKDNPSVIVLGNSSFVNEEELANTIAHELNHARSYMKGGDAPESTAYAAGDAITSYIRGQR